MCSGFSVAPNASGAGQGMRAMHRWAEGTREIPRAWDTLAGQAGPLCSCPLWVQPPLSPARVAPLQWHLGTGSTWPGVGSGCPAGVGTPPPSAVAPRSRASPGSGSRPEQMGEICKQALTGPRCLPSPCTAAGLSRGMGMLEWGPVGHRGVTVLPTLPGDSWVGTDPAPALGQLGRKRAEPGMGDKAPCRTSRQDGALPC